MLVKGVTIDPDFSYIELRSDYPTLGQIQNGGMRANLRGLTGDIHERRKS